ncbi:MAG: tetratricopeptide repeat protein [Sulfuricaulis sp.]
MKTSDRHVEKSNLSGISFLAKLPKLSIVLTCFLLILGGLVYLPGVSGPYVFDDATNLLDNHYVQLTNLNWNSLWHAAFSMDSGPLHRPIAMLSFALNYYFAGSFDNSTPFKLTNIAIHVTNGLLLFWLLRLIFTRLAETASITDPVRQLKNNNYILLFAAGITFLWLIHPIQVTSVLYLVQRMAALAASFMLLGLLCYLKGRLRIISGQANGFFLILLGLFGFGTLGMFTKEDAALLPLFMLALEFTLFQREFPWSSWKKLSRPTKRILVSILAILLALAFIWLLHYVQPSYADRNFTLIERLLTETRALFFYIFLILVPRIDQFAIYHDDFSLSTSLITPWTTLPAVLGIAALLVIALVYRKKYPLLSLGVVWFFVGHALESTFLGLELVHEHRNYLASLGVWLVVLHLILYAQQKFDIRKLWIILPLFAVAFSGVTAYRSFQWSNFDTLALYEATHHPTSADAQNFLGVAMAYKRHYAVALGSFRRAAQLKPRRAIYYVNMAMVASRLGISLSAKEQADAVQSLIADPDSGSTLNALLNLSTCIEAECRSLGPTVINWTNHLIESGKGDVSFDYYILGMALSGQNRFEEAVTALRHSYQLDNEYLLPRIEIVKIYIQKNDVKQAEETLAELRIANRRNPLPRNAEIAELAKEIDELVHGGKISS